MIKTKVLVIGSGPGGYTAAFRAADLGNEVILVESHESLGLDGTESYSIPVSDDVQPLQMLTVTSLHPNGTTLTFQTQVRLDTPVEVEYYRNGGILHTVLRQLVKQE